MALIVYGMREATNVPCFLMMFSVEASNFLRHQCVASLYGNSYGKATQ
jgi:hypothetical protein